MCKKIKCFYQQPPCCYNKIYNCTRGRRLLQHLPDPYYPCATFATDLEPTVPGNPRGVEGPEQHLPDPAILGDIATAPVDRQSQAIQGGSRGSHSKTPRLGPAYNLGWPPCAPLTKRYNPRSMLG